MPPPVPFSEATLTLTNLLRAYAHPPILAWLQEMFASSLPGGTGTCCPVCGLSGAIDGKTNLCGLCLWRGTTTPTLKSGRDHLLTIGCLAIYGLAAIPALRITHHSPAQIIRAFTVLVATPASCRTLREVMTTILHHPGPLDQILIEKWPLEMWRTIQAGEFSLLDCVAPLVQVETLRNNLNDAYRAFREGRWPQGIRCPRCEVRAISAGLRHLGADRLQPVHRWRCLRLNQRVQKNRQRRTRRNPERNPRENGRRVRLDGCGNYFSDTSDTVFADSKIPLSDWLFLLTYGPVGLTGILAAGVSEATCCRMLEKLLLVADNDSDFLIRLHAEASRFVLRGTQIPRQRTTDSDTSQS